MKKNIFVVSFLFFLAVLTSGCGTKLVETVAFKAYPNLETVELKVELNKNWNIGFGGSYSIPLPSKPYGLLSAQPTTATTPFNISFRLNLDIVNDPEYNDKVKYKPTTVLPTGYPIPAVVGRAMAMVKGVNPIDKNVDLYTYVDVLGKEWIGVALVFPTLNLSIIPPNFTLFEQFLNAMASITAFGQAVDMNGKKVGAPGFALFANLKELLAQAKTSGKTSAQTSVTQEYIFF